MEKMLFQIIIPSPNIMVFLPGVGVTSLIRELQLERNKGTGVTCPEVLLNQASVMLYHKASAWRVSII